MKKKRSSLFGAAAALALASMSAGGTTLATTPSAQSENKSQATLPKEVATRPVSERTAFGGFSNANPFKHNWGYKNQRQYRKWLRQNPHMRNSKKARKNNK